MGQTVHRRPVDRHVHAAWLTSALCAAGRDRAGDASERVRTPPRRRRQRSGEARDDGGGLSGRSCAPAADVRGRTGPPGSCQFGNWATAAHAGVPWKAVCSRCLVNLRFEEHFERNHPSTRTSSAPNAACGCPRCIMSPWWMRLRSAPGRIFLFRHTDAPAFLRAEENLAVDTSRQRCWETVPFCTRAPRPAQHRTAHAFGWQQPRLWAQLHLRPTPWLTLLRADEGTQRRSATTFVRTNVIPSFLKRWAQPSVGGGEVPGGSLLQEPEDRGHADGAQRVVATWRTRRPRRRARRRRPSSTGIFTRGNHLFNPYDACRLIDFQFVGTGRVADEVAYFFTMSFGPITRGREELLPPLPSRPC